MPRLLVVDDEPNVLFSLAESLKSPALDVLTALTAREGIELVRRAARCRHPRRAAARHVGPGRLRPDP